MLEYVFLYYIFTQAGIHIWSVFSKCSMSLLRNNQVWLLPLGLPFFPLMRDVLSMVYCKMKTRTEKERETNKSWADISKELWASIGGKKGVTLTILHEAGTRLWRGTAWEEIWEWQRWGGKKGHRGRKGEWRLFKVQRCVLHNHIKRRFE